MLDALWQQLCLNDGGIRITVETDHANQNKKQNLLQSLQDYGAIAVKINRRMAKLPVDTEQALR